MVEPNVYKPRMREFYSIMEAKMGLPKNVAKGDWRGSGTDTTFLFNALNAEVSELSDELIDGTPESIAKECADIANFAMMIADRVQNG